MKVLCKGVFKQTTNVCFSTTVLERWIKIGNDTFYSMFSLFIVTPNFYPQTPIKVISESKYASSVSCATFHGNFPKNVFMLRRLVPLE